MVGLEQLGNKICIIGCTSSGKSTLAKALSQKLNIPAYHLDLFAHKPHSKWLRVPDNELINSQNKILSQDCWIIEGNYSICMKERFDQATSIIWLNPNVIISVLRYIWRSFKNSPDRPGRLLGAKTEFQFWLVKHILFVYPKNRMKYRQLLEGYPHLPTLELNSMTVLNQYYTYWDL